MHFRLDRDRVAQVERLVVPRLRAVLEASGPAEALAALGSFRVLCALREGPWGVGAFNELVERALRRAGLVPRDREAYRGRPVMVTRNDYATGLFNGDVGVFWSDTAAGGALRVFFPAPGGGLRALLPARLPAHETVYAMTVHKSQGSEFDEVLLVLPERVSPVLTRELLYTAVTRARAGVEIWGPEATVAAAVGARVERASGLRDALWGDAPARARDLRVVPCHALAVGAPLGGQALAAAAGVLLQGARVLLVLELSPARLGAGAFRLLEARLPALARELRETARALQLVPRLDRVELGEAFVRQSGCGHQHGREDQGRGEPERAEVRRVGKSAHGTS